MKKAIAKMTMILALSAMSVSALQAFEIRLPWIRPSGGSMPVPSPCGVYNRIPCPGSKLPPPTQPPSPRPGPLAPRHR